MSSAISVNKFYPSIPVQVERFNRQDQINAILSENSDEIGECFANSVNHIMANGYLPLHFAVLENKPEAVKKLLEMHANPVLKDSQNLSALDHACILQNRTISILILSRILGPEIQQIKIEAISTEQQKNIQNLKVRCDRIATHCEQVKKQVRNKEHLPIFQAAIDGKLEALTAEAISLTDSIGMTPLHYAVLAGQLDAVKKLHELGANLTILTKDNHSLLHLAAIAKSPEILRYLIEQGVKVQAINDQGETALHLSAAFSDLKSIQLLIENKASPLFCCKQGLSPMTLLYGLAEASDPLALSSSQILMFCSYIVTNAVLHAVQSEYITDRTIALLATDGIIYSRALLYGCQFFQSFPTFLGLLASDVLCVSSPAFNLALKTFLTAQIARSAFAGLKACWNQAHYRTTAAIRNVIVLSTNTFASFGILRSALQNISVQPLTLTRILNPNLNPKNKNDAKYILNPDFDSSKIDSNPSDSCDRGAKKYIEAQYRETAKKIHPDSASQEKMNLIEQLSFDALNLIKRLFLLPLDKQSTSEANSRLVEAKETLINSIHCQKKTSQFRDDLEG